MLWRKLQDLAESGTDAVVVTVIGVRGSVPADPGAKMIVTGAGLVWGTVGGGKIEARALSEAIGLLADPKAVCKSDCWNLQRDVGMTCGGEMTLLFEVHRALPIWRIYLFGAGHVAQALVPVLQTLSCRVTVFEVREDWLVRLPEGPNMKKCLVARFEDGVGEIEDGGFVLSITQGHSMDFPVLRDVFLSERHLPFVGVIGSASKRAVLARDLREAGISREKIGTLVCPLGLPIGGNSPAEIAISIAAQLLKTRDSPPEIN